MTTEEGRFWSKKYKKYKKWWIDEYDGEHYQMILHADLLPNETIYSSTGLTWKMMRCFVNGMLKKYGNSEVERELGIKIGGEKDGI